MWCGVVGVGGLCEKGREEGVGCGEARSASGGR